MSPVPAALRLLAWALSFDGTTGGGARKTPLAAVRDETRHTSDGRRRPRIEAR